MQVAVTVSETVTVTDKVPKTVPVTMTEIFTHNNT